MGVSTPKVRAAEQARARSAASGAQYPSRFVQLLASPAAFFATNWAALLLAATIVGLVPALVAATRTTADLEAHGERAFRETLRHGASVIRRDWAVSLALVLVAAMGVGNALILATQASGGTRVFLAGIALAPTWAVIALFSAYLEVAAQAESGAGALELATRALALALGNPLRALGAPALVIVLCPVWLLAPLTIAVGLSLPPWILHRWWSAALRAPR